MANAIYVCFHCGVQKTTENKFCQHCDTAEKRRAMDDENKKLWQENKMKEYQCNFCHGTGNH